MHYDLAAVTFVFYLYLVLYQMLLLLMLLVVSGVYVFASAFVCFVDAVLIYVFVVVVAC